MVFSRAVQLAHPVPYHPLHDGLHLPELHSALPIFRFHKLHQGHAEPLVSLLGENGLRELEVVPLGTFLRDIMLTMVRMVNGHVQQAEGEGSLKVLQHTRLPNHRQPFL